MYRNPGTAHPSRPGYGMNEEEGAISECGRSTQEAAKQRAFEPTEISTRNQAAEKAEPLLFRALLRGGGLLLLLIGGVTLVLLLLGLLLDGFR
jgi:hypothetical protein